MYDVKNLFININSVVLSYLLFMFKIYVYMSGNFYPDENELRLDI